MSTDACGATERCAPSLSRTDDGSGLQHVSVCLARVSLGAEAEADRKLVADAVGGDTDVLELMGTDRPSIYVLQHEDDQQWPDSVSCRPPLCPIRLVSLESDGGALFAAADIGETPPRTPVALLDSVFPTTVYVGNGPQAAYSKDGYELTVTSEQPGDVSITRVRPTSDTNEDGGQLDLNVFYVGALDWRPTGARGPELLERGLEVVDGIFAQADIFIGEVRQFAVPGQLVTRGNVFDGIDDPGAGFETLKRRFGVWPELPALLALSGGAPGPGINLFFVRDIEGMGSGDVRALSGGTPGPLGMHGTGASGIAIATDMMNARPAELGRTIAHEIAHHLGLFHTSERNGDVLDPFDDTPSCTSNADRDGDGLLSASECEGAGTENLMFWANTQATALSEQQIAVLRQAMVLQR